MAVEIGWGYPSITKEVEEPTVDEEVKEEPKVDEEEEAKPQDKKKK